MFPNVALWFCFDSALNYGVFSQLILKKRKKVKMSRKNDYKQLKRNVDSLRKELECFESGVKRLKTEGQANASDSDTVEKIPDGLFDIDFFVQSQDPGLQYVAVNIFKCLDPKSLGNCRQTSKVWKDFIDNEKEWWQALLNSDNRWAWYARASYATLYGRCYGKRYQDLSLNRMKRDFDNSMVYICEEGPAKSIKVFVRFLLDYSLSTRQIRDCGASPLHYAVDQNRVDILKILADSPYMRYFNLRDLTVKRSDITFFKREEKLFTSL